MTRPLLRKDLQPARKAPLLGPVSYDTTKDTVTLWFPAAATLYQGLASIWNLPLSSEVGATITALVTFFGIVLKISSNRYNNGTPVYDGEVGFDVVDGKTVLRSSLDLDAEELKGKKEIVLKVNSDGTWSQ